MNIIGRKYWYFAISLLVILPGLISLFLWGLDLSIDFKGGTELTVSYPKSVGDAEKSFVRKSLENEKVKVETLQASGKVLTVKTSTMSQAQDNAFVKNLSKQKGARQEEFTTIGPTIGAETTQNALKAVAFASLLIV